MANPLPCDVRRRLAKLVPMLSSDQPGEVANAAALINKVLRDAGLDIHDLNDIVTGEAPATVVATAPEPASDLHLYQRADGRFEIPSPELETLLGTIREQVYVSAWENDFLTGFEGRCAKYPDSLIFLSEKQLKIITRLVERLPQ